MDSCLKCMLHKWLLSVTKSYLNYPNYSLGKSWQVMEAFLVLMMRRTYCGMEKVNIVCCFFHIECNFISVASDGLYRNQWTIFIAVLWQLSREIFKEIQLLTKKQEQIAGWKDTICLGVRMGKSTKNNYQVQSRKWQLSLVSVPIMCAFISNAVAGHWKHHCCKSKVFGGSRASLSPSAIHFWVLKTSG